MPAQLNTWYGRLYTMARLPKPRGQGRTEWLCRCRCGKAFVVVKEYRLVCGTTRSCGCSRKLRGGLSHSPTYITWQAMRRRCNDPRHPRYVDYGGRGIVVCERWNDRKTGFDAFIADMGLRPPGLTLDRRDNSRGYEPGNVRWATILEQRWNRRDMASRIAQDSMAEMEYWERRAREEVATDVPF